MRSTATDVERATRVWIEAGWVCLRLADDREVRFLAAKNRRLRNAPTEKLEKVEIICNGTGIHWPELDEDLSVKGILEGRLGPA
jgi:hypothetical protein